MKSGRAIIKTVESYECLIVPVKEREKKKEKKKSHRSRYDSMENKRGGNG